MACWGEYVYQVGCYQGFEEGVGQGIESERPGSPKGSTMKYADCRGNQHLGSEVIH